MKTLFLSALLVVALSVVSTAAPKSRTLLRKPLSMDTIVEVCGEPDAGYKMENVLGVSDFMLFVHSSCQYRHGAIAVVFNGDVGVKKIKTESALMGQPPPTHKFTVIMFELFKKKVSKR